MRTEKKYLAHREGRTRSLQITRTLCVLHARRKSLTLYPIELGGHYSGYSSNIYVIDPPIISPGGLMSVCQVYINTADVALYKVCLIQ